MLTFDNWYRSIYPRILSKEAYDVAQELFREISALREENRELILQTITLESDLAEAHEIMNDAREAIKAGCIPNRLLGR